MDVRNETAKDCHAGGDCRERPARWDSGAWSPILLLKTETVSSILACPTTRPALAGKWLSFFPLFPPGGCRAHGMVAHRKSDGLQSRGHRFESCPSLQRVRLPARLSPFAAGRNAAPGQILPGLPIPGAHIRIRPGTVCPLSVRHGVRRSADPPRQCVPAERPPNFIHLFSRKAPRKDGAAAGGIPLPGARELCLLSKIPWHDVPAMFTGQKTGGERCPP